MGGAGRNPKPRRKPSAGTSATVFAMSTLVLLGLAAAADFAVMPEFFGTRLLSLVGAGSTGSPPLPRIAGALAVLSVSLYVFARATRNATLEVDRIRSRLPKLAWMLLFEGIWVVGLVFVGEGLATHAGLLSEYLPLPSFVSVAGTRSCVAMAAAWVLTVLATVARCAVARHEHAGRHAACYALRAIGRSTLVVLVWSAAMAVLTADGWVSLVAAWGILVLSAAVVVVPCLAEGRRRGRSHGKGR